MPCPERNGATEAGHQAALTVPRQIGDADLASGIAAGASPMSLDPLGSRSPRGLLAVTTVLALVMGIGAFGVAHQLARTVDRQVGRVASLPPGIVDPETTGAIGPSMRSIVLDPCLGKEKLIVRGP